jgi:hypothetical protein
VSKLQMAALACLCAGGAQWEAILDRRTSWGLHALQVLPFFGWLLMRRKRSFNSLREGHRVVLVWTAGFGYLGMVLLLTWQALRGESLIHPGATTTVAFIILVAAVTIPCCLASCKPKQRLFVESI